MTADRTDKKRRWPTLVVFVILCGTAIALIVWMRKPTAPTVRPTTVYLSVPRDSVSSRGSASSHGSASSRGSPSDTVPGFHPIAEKRAALFHALNYEMPEHELIPTREDRIYDYDYAYQKPWYAKWFGVGWKKPKNPALENFENMKRQKFRENQRKHVLESQTDGMFSRTVPISKMSRKALAFEDDHPYTSGLNWEGHKGMKDAVYLKRQWMDETVPAQLRKLNIDPDQFFKQNPDLRKGYF